MSDSDELSGDLYRGKPVEELTREELITAVRTLGRLYSELLEKDRDRALEARFYDRD